MRNGCWVLCSSLLKYSLNLDVLRIFALAAENISHASFITKWLSIFVSQKRFQINICTHMQFGNGR